MTFTFAELKAMPKQEQITEHFCIQGWSGVARWGGVPMRHILELVKPKPHTRYAVFYSFADAPEGGRFTTPTGRFGEIRESLQLLPAQRFPEGAVMLRRKI